MTETNLDMDDLILETVEARGKHQVSFLDFLAMSGSFTGQEWAEIEQRINLITTHSGESK